MSATNFTDTKKGLPFRHAHGRLATNTVWFHRASRHLRDRIRRWAKRVMRREAEKNQDVVG